MMPAISDNEESPAELCQSSLAVFYSSSDEAVCDGVCSANDEVAAGDDHEGQVSSSPSSSPPPPLYVLQFSPRAAAATVDWYVARVQARRRHGGAELLVATHVPARDSGVVLHVSASGGRLLEAAELMQLQLVERRSGRPREFVRAELAEFVSGGGEDGGRGDGHHLLSDCQKQRIVRHELLHVRASASTTAGQCHVPGRPDIRLYPGQSVTQLLVQHGVIVQMFPLHDMPTLDKLGQSWYAALFQRQPFDDIRSYFGESVAMYFSFLGFYTTALLGPALLGLVQFVCGVDSAHEYALYAVFNMLWVTVFLEAWKRKCNELAFTWGVLDKTQMSFLEPRAAHWGQMKRDQVTGRFMPHYPRWKTLLKLYAVSLPVVCLCLLGSFYLMLLSFWAEEHLTLNRQHYGNNVHAGLILVPSVIYSALVLVMNKSYNRLASALTEWENHRTDKQFDYYRVIKLVLFEFVNSFMCLFYIGFYMQDMEMLRGQLAVMLIVQQLISHFQEALLPIVFRKYYSRVRSYLAGWFSRAPVRPSDVDDDARGSTWTPRGVHVLSPQHQHVLDVKWQLQLDPYPDTHEDYLEMFVQFGYAFLFSPVFPMAAFWAVLNNVLEIRADAFKLCRVHQRPAAKTVRNIGAWMPAFEVMGVLAAITNCALLCLSSAVRDVAPGHLGADHWLAVFVVAEHAMLALKLLVRQAVPDVPGWVRRAVARQQYHVRQQLHHQRRRDIRRRMKSDKLAADKLQATQTPPALSSHSQLRQRH